MTTLSQFTGTRNVASIVNAYSTNGFSLLGGLSTLPAMGKNYATTAQSANALRDILVVSGRGALNFVGVISTGSATKALRLKITVDGVVIFDGTSANEAIAANYGFVAIGVPTAAAPTMQPVVFKTSCKVEMSSSAASDTEATTVINYETDV